MLTSEKTQSYRPDIDGLRAIAVLAVLTFHAQLGCPGGFVGVDIFFVISGYLITGILQRDIDAGRFSIVRFYERRIRRIFPALFAVLLPVALLGFRFLPPRELQDLGKCLVAAAAFVSNILYFRRSGYFNAASVNQPLLHTWTLSVEEQFYIFWPWILALLSSRRVVRLKPWIVLLLVALSLGLSGYWVYARPEAAFYMLPSRAWELGLGAILSIAPFTGWTRRMPRGLANILSISGLFMVLAAIFRYSSLLPFPGIAALLPCAGAAILIAASEGGSSLGGRILSWKPLVFIGLISYSLYLWHWPILFFARVIHNDTLTVADRVACIGLALLFSWASWKWIETPFRDPKFGAGKTRTWIVGGLATTAAFVLAGLVFVRAAGFPQREPEVEKWVESQNRTAQAKLIDSPCLAWNDSVPAEQKCLLGANPRQPSPTVILWGDSNAAHLAPSFDHLGRNLNLISRQVTKAGCPPLLGIRVVPVNSMNIGCPAFNGNALRTILSSPNVQVVVLAAIWTHLADGSAAAPAHGRYQNSVASRGLFVWSLRQTLASITKTGRQVVLVGQIPSPQLDPILCLARARMNHWSESSCVTMPADGPAEEDALVSRALAEASQGMPAVRIVHPYDAFCNSHSCMLVSNGQPLYWDPEHLSDVGAERLDNMLQVTIADSMLVAETGNPRI